MTQTYRNPFPTVDIIIARRDAPDTIVLIERANPPHGYALPGGFVDVGETLEAAAVREALEETGLQVDLVCLLNVYSDPARDPRHHTVSAVYVALADGNPRGMDDARTADWFHLDQLPSLAFDHARILRDYKNHYLSGDRRMFLVAGS